MACSVLGLYWALLSSGDRIEIAHWFVALGGDDAASPSTLDPTSARMLAREVEFEQEFRRIIKATPQDLCQRFAEEGFQNKGWRRLTMGGGYGCSSDVITIGRAPLLESRRDDETAQAADQATVFFSMRGPSVSDVASIRFQGTAGQDALMRPAIGLITNALETVLADLGEAPPEEVLTAFREGRSFDQRIGGVHWKVLTLSGLTEEGEPKPVSRHLLARRTKGGHPPFVLFPNGF
ncbi:DUF6030 family protein [Pseudovibrio sp. SPO723]|uniref:DUF6030 family protein n=1 Tax=Nesiotobacter zosterae TaxID=392721 RepID=UPI0029C59459|nr:DUF6030 family protein [Pseudovibrio sp. SPO723]MDX5593594.1 DUF6030 family protein [Pseudovibrio sp. SPO723]